MFWKLLQETLEEFRPLSEFYPRTIVAASIIVTDDDAEIVSEWELGGEP